LNISDYLEIDAHKFSEEHLYFNDEGFNGFSDYTIIPSEYNETGSMPRAVVATTKIWFFMAIFLFTPSPG
jgi:hypothetical protein